MNTKHVPDRELCQEFDRLRNEKGIVVPWTEYQWEKRWDNWPVIKSRVPGERYVDTADLRLYLPAPLVSEQGEWLPFYLANIGELTVKKNYVRDTKTGWNCRYEKTINCKKTLPVICADTEANARQKLLNHLIAEGIITTLK